MEPEPGAGQPSEGQAGTGAPDVPYQEYLNRVPEEVRGDIAPIFHDWNSAANRRFEEHAQYRKQWEPWEQAGLNQYQPQDVQGALELLNDPQRLREWADQTYGPAQAQQQPQQPQDPYQELYQDPVQQLDERLKPILDRIEQFDQRWQQMEQQQQQAHVASVIESEIAKLREQHGSSLPEKVDLDDIIHRFSQPHLQPGADPAQVVQNAWQDFQALQNQLSTHAIQQKVDQPRTPVTGGEADLSVEKPKSLAEANKAALEMIRATQTA